jgi:hypothetical protein
VACRSLRSTIAKNASLSLRLAKDDVHDLTDPSIKFRDVQPGKGFQVNRSVIDTAVELTQRALHKVRGED